MKTKISKALLMITGSVLMSCSTPSDETTMPEKLPELSHEALIARGKYLTTIGGCNDCHSPKIMTPHGPELDTTRLLSGHPQNEPLSPVVKTKDWILFNNGLTAFVGPWGVSYAANLTPDDTGIGNWKYEQFVTAIQKGKYKGLETGRPLLPPMPWQMYRTMTDEDLKAIFTYLKSLPPVNNLVPVPIAPNTL